MRIVYNAAEVKADLYATIPGTNEINLLLGNITKGDITSPTVWQYIASSSATDDYANGVIQPTLQTGTGRWIRQDNCNYPIVGAGGLTSVGLTSSDLAVSGSPLTSNGSITCNLSTTGIAAGTYIGATTFDNKGRATASRNPSFNAVSSGGKSFNTAYTISASSYVEIKISASISCNLSLTGGQAGEIYLEKSANGTTGWAVAAVLSSSNVGTLTIGLNTTQLSGGQLSTLLPPGYFWRLRTNNTTGTPTFSFLGGEEITY